MLKSVLIAIVCFTVFCPALTIPAVEAEESTENLFSVSLPYCYFATKNGTFEDVADPLVFDSDESNKESCGLSLVLNCTLLDYPENQSIGAVADYYKIVAKSDKVTIMKRSKSMAISKSDSFSERISEFNRDSRDTYFGTYAMSGGGFTARNWTVGESQLIPQASIASSTNTYNPTAQAIKEAQTITVSIYYLGTVIFTENTTEVLTEPNLTVVEQIQLKKYYEGWLYNTLIPETELSETNLMHTMPNIEPEIPEFSTGTIFFGIIAAIFIVMLTKKKLRPR